MIQVIDASVAIKWFMAHEKGRDESLKVLAQIEKGPSHFAVPELFFSEMLAVLCRLSKDEEKIKCWMHSLENLGMERIGNGHELLSEAIHLATQFKISGYDAIYAATAKLIRGKWLTADSAAHKRVKDQKLSELLSEDS